VGIFNAGTAVGAAIAAPLVSWIALTWGWRYAFVLGAALGFVWVVAWAFLYRLPGSHPRLGAEELALIHSGEAAQEEQPPAVPIRRILGRKAVWGCILARMLTDPISYFFIFWTPKFLQQERGFDLADIGRYSGIPFIALAFGNIAGGAIPGLLMRQGWSLNRSRKTVMFGSTCLIPVCCLAITQVPNAALAVTLISLAMFCHAAWANMTLPAEVFPKHVVGSVTGFAGAMGGVMGIASQQAIGWTVQHVSFTPVFIVCAIMYPLAFAAVCLFVGRLGVVKPLDP
jgi:ACS family hexuronate transporter-like MFS transporter